MSSESADDADAPGILRFGGDLPVPRLPHHPGDLARGVGPPPFGHGHHVNGEEYRSGRADLPVVEEELLNRHPSPGRKGRAGPPQQADAVVHGEGVQDLRYPDEIVRAAEGILEEVALYEADAAFHTLLPENLSRDPERPRGVEHGDLHAGAC